MGFGELRALTLEINELAHGVDITIAVPSGGDPIVGRGIWLTFNTPDSADGISRGGRDVFRNWRDVERVMAISRATLDAVPTKTRILAPEQDGGAARWWSVDTVAAKYADRTHVVLTPELT